MSDDFRLRQAARNHAAVKQHYLNKGRTEQQWQAVSNDPQKFNRVWRSLLRLPLNDQPPPESYRA